MRIEYDGSEMKDVLHILTHPRGASDLFPWVILSPLILLILLAIFLGGVRFYYDS